MRHKQRHKHGTGADKTVLQPLKP